MKAETARPPVPETKAKLLAAAVQLMLAQGYNATAVDEVCAAAGVTKGSFFHYFESKEAIAKAALQVFCERQMGVFAAADFRKFPDPLDRVFGRFDFLAKLLANPQMPRACLVGNFTQELANTHPEIRCVCECSLDGAAEDFARDLAAAKKRHAPHAKFDPVSVGRLYVTLIQGSMILAKAAQDFTVFAENVGHLRRYVESLFAVAQSKRKSA